MSFSKWTFAAVLAVAGCAFFAGNLPAADPPKDAKPKKFVAITEEDAGPDFKVQGEYEGKAGDAKLGAQVIALGKGAFQIVFLPGGLPGQGWDGKTRIEVKTASEAGKIGFDAKEFSGSLDGEKLTGKSVDGQIDLAKVHRKSPTMGAKPPEGAIVLFDGSSADAWNRGSIDTRGLLSIAKGNLETKQKFGDFSLHVEFILPFMPEDRGQGRGNSGVYMQNRYECQVLDSFGLTGENNECGGIYTVAKPKVNMCYPPLAWQTYDIDFTAARYENGKKVANARATVKHNGVLIHDNIEIPKKTGGGQEEGEAPAPLQLQNHGNPVFYRNIWIMPK